jgi:hypothetical protein
MQRLTRRAALGLGAASASAFLTAAAPATDENANDEGPVRFKIKDVVIERVKQEERTIDVRFGKAARPIKVAGLPLAETIGIRVSHIFPGSVNNLPFHWDRLKALVGKTVSMVIVAELDTLSVATIATAND